MITRSEVLPPTTQPVWPLTDKKPTSSDFQLASGRDHSFPQYYFSFTIAHCLSFVLATASPHWTSSTIPISFPGNAALKKIPNISNRSQQMLSWASSHCTKFPPENYELMHFTRARKLVDNTKPVNLTQHNKIPQITHVHPRNFPRQVCSPFPSSRLPLSRGKASIPGLVRNKHQRIRFRRFGHSDQE